MISIYLFRNKVAHEINLNIKANFTIAALMTGISLISRIVEYRKTFKVM